MPTYDPTGVKPGQVGPTFDYAFGYYDPNTEMVKMVGYVVPPSAGSQEGTDVTDDSHIVQIASPNSTDRVARFPQVSQGDWSKGERQRVYIDPSRYYLSDGGIDVSTPGNLTQFPAPVTTTVTLTGAYNTVPVQSDEGSWYAGIKDNAGNNLYIGNGSTPSASGTTCNGHEIMDMLYTPAGLVALTNQGTWYIINGSPPSSIHVVNASQPSPQLANRSMAYLDNVTYYIKNDDTATDSVIRGWTGIDGTTDQTYVTANISERYFSCIADTASGLFVSTFSNLPYQSFWYTWDGTASGTLNRIQAIQGRTLYAQQVNGVLYVLMSEFQHSFATNPSWTLYSVVGSQVTLVDDARAITDVNFEPTCTSVNYFNINALPSTDFKPFLWSDGRFLYVAWPGLATRRIDLGQTGISQIGTNTSSGQSAVSARRFVTSNNAPYIDFSAYGSTCVINQYVNPAGTNTLTSSFDDFGSPGTGKVFRVIEYQASQPLTGTQAISFAYRLDQNDSYTNLPSRQVGPRNYVAVFPTDVKGTEIQTQVALTGDVTAGPPTLTSMTVVADLGRVLTVTVACRRVQQSRAQDQAAIDAQPYTGQQLQANLMNIRNVGGGYFYAFIPDPTQDDGVAQIQMKLLDLQRNTPNGASTGQRSVNGDLDMECDVQISAFESFDPI